MKPYILNANKHGELEDSIFTEDMEYFRGSLNAQQVSSARKKEYAAKQDEKQRARRRMKQDLKKMLEEESNNCSGENHMFEGICKIPKWAEY